MVPTIQILVLLLDVIAVVAVVAVRLKIPSAILWVLTGVVLAVVPDLPTVELAPELVLLLVLPPVIYSSAVPSGRGGCGSLRRHRLVLPRSLMDTVSALKTSTLFREKMGSEFIDYIVAIKEFEVAGRARDTLTSRGDDFL